MLCGLDLFFGPESSNEDDQMTIEAGPPKVKRPNLEKIVPTRVCNYSINPTPLYLALESKNFDHAICILNDETNAQRTNATALRGYEQANTWIIREKDDKVCWKVLPLHAAIILCAPYDVINLLIELSPKSPKLPDDTGMLPLHVAYRRGADEEVIGRLITIYPGGVTVKDKQGRLPHECAKGEKSLASIYGQLREKEFHSLTQRDFRIINETLYATLHELHKANDAQMVIAKEVHQEDLKKLSEEYELRMSQLRGQNYAQMEKMQKFDKERILLIENKHVTEISKLIDHHTSQVLQLNRKILLAEEELSNARRAKEQVEELMKKIDAKEEEIKSLSIQREELRSDVAQLTNELRTTRHSLEEREAEKKKATERLEMLQKELLDKDAEITELKKAAAPGVMGCFPSCFLPTETYSRGRRVVTAGSSVESSLVAFDSRQIVVS